MIHKKVKVLFGTMALTSMVYAQQPQTGTPGNSSDWRRGGNLAAPPGQGGTNNIFGTIWNSPIYTQTNGIQRTKLNGSLNYTVNGFNDARSGYLLLGNNVAPNSSLFNNANEDAFSMLHLAGSEGTFVQTGGYRPWMKTGVTFTDNNDLSYMGLRQIGSNNDKTETVLAWSDNGGNNFTLYNALKAHFVG